MKTIDEKCEPLLDTVVPGAKIFGENKSTNTAANKQVAKRTTMAINIL